MEKFDLIVIGGGIVGLASALQLLMEHHQLSVCILEKEDSLASQQTGHNSGVIHSGIYYKPGSYKAKNCRAGVSRLLDYCQEKGIAFDLCGKVIVATEEEELPRLQELQRRAQANGVPDAHLISGDQLRELEPHCRGLQALYSPHTGIIDYRQVALSYAEDVRRLGGCIHLSSPVLSMQESGQEILCHTPKGSFRARFLINCSGIQADRIAAMSDGAQLSERILPFRGEYYLVRPERRHLVKSLIYPVPDPRFPFLGVHLTRGIDGSVEAGPNAVLALSRYGYRKFDLNLRDVWSAVSYPGFWAMARRYWRMGCSELHRSFSKGAFLRSLQRFVPELNKEDLLPGGSGVRSQVILRDGRMQDDFLFVHGEHSLHVVNAPSPGATASLAIGSEIAEAAMKRLGLARTEVQCQRGAPSSTA